MIAWLKSIGITSVIAGGAVAFVYAGQTWPETTLHVFGWFIALCFFALITALIRYEIFGYKEMTKEKNREP